jgi:hypothetical protein
MVVPRPSTVFLSSGSRRSVTIKRNGRAIHNYCKDGELQAGMMLIFQQMPNCQRKSREVIQSNVVPRPVSASITRRFRRAKFSSISLPERQ